MKGVNLLRAARWGAVLMREVGTSLVIGIDNASRDMQAWNLGLTPDVMPSVRRDIDELKARRAGTGPYHRRGVSDDVAPGEDLG